MASAGEDDFGSLDCNNRSSVKRLVVPVFCIVSLNIDKHLLNISMSLFGGVEMLCEATTG